MSGARYRAVPPRRGSRVRQVLARLGTLATDVARIGTERWHDGMTQVVRESARELDQLGLDRAAAVVAEVFAHLDAAGPAGLAGLRGRRVAPGLGSGLAGGVPGANARPRGGAGSLQATLAAASARRSSRSIYARVAPARPGSQTPEEDPLLAPAHLARALLKLALLAGAARDYPAGPAPRALVEPLLRGALHPDERPLFKGRVLVPLCEREGRRLAWDLGGLGLVEVPFPELPADRCGLAGRLIVAHAVTADGVTSARLRRVTAGLPVGPSTDRAVLAAARPHLADILRDCLHELADPFVRQPSPRLVGPLTHVRTDAALRLDVLADARGEACTVSGLLATADGSLSGGCTWYVLAVPRSRDGLLELEPLVAWARPRGSATARIAPARAAPDAAPASEEILDDCADALADLQASGLARGLASRDEVRALAGRVAEHGHGALAARLRDLPDAPEERAGVLLHGALHLVDRLRSGPRALSRRPEPEISK